MSEINDIKELPEVTFPIHLKLIQNSKRTEHSIKSKYKYGTYHKCSFRGVSNTYLKLIMCKDHIFILSILQSYILHWYHTYLLHLVMDITEAIVCQNLYWSDIRYFIRKKVTNCDTYQRTKISNKQYVILPDKLAEEIPWNKICVDILGPYVIRRKVQK